MFRAGILPSAMGGGQIKQPAEAGCFIVQTKPEKRVLMLSRSVPTAPQAVQKSAAVLASDQFVMVAARRCTACACAGCTELLASSGAFRMPICCSGKPLSSRTPSMA